MPMVTRDIYAQQIPGSPGTDSAAATASATAFATPGVLLVTTAGTFSFTTLAGTARTSVALPAGLYPVYLTKITAIADGGVGEVIFQ
jgi:hypothetical protein